MMLLLPVQWLTVGWHPEDPLCCLARACGTTCAPELGTSECVSVCRPFQTSGVCPHQPTGTCRQSHHPSALWLAAPGRLDASPMWTGDPTLRCPLWAFCHAPRTAVGIRFRRLLAHRLVEQGAPDALLEALHAHAQWIQTTMPPLPRWLELIDPMTLGQHAEDPLMIAFWTTASSLTPSTSTSTSTTRPPCCPDRLCGTPCPRAIQCPYSHHPADFWDHHGDRWSPFWAEDLPWLWVMCHAPRNERGRRQRRCLVNMLVSPDNVDGRYGSTGLLEVLLRHVRWLLLDAPSPMRVPPDRVHDLDPVGLGNACMMHPSLLRMCHRRRMHPGSIGKTAWNREMWALTFTPPADPVRRMAIHAAWVPIPATVYLRDAITEAVMGLWTTTTASVEEEEEGNHHPQQRVLTFTMRILPTEEGTAPPSSLPVLLQRDSSTGRLILLDGTRQWRTWSCTAQMLLQPGDPTWVIPDPRFFVMHRDRCWTLACDPVAGECWFQPHLPTPEVPTPDRTAGHGWSRLQPIIIPPPPPAPPQQPQQRRASGGGGRLPREVWLAVSDFIPGSCGALRATHRFLYDALAHRHVLLGGLNLGNAPHVLTALRRTVPETVSLRLSLQDATPHAAHILGSVLNAGCCPALTQLDVRLSGGSVGSEGAVALGRMVRDSQSLTALSLGLSGHTLGTQGVCALTAALRRTNTMRSLHLGLFNTHIRDNGAAALGDLLAHLPLRDLSLDVRSNAINDSGARRLLDALAAADQLRSLALQLGFNHIVRAASAGWGAVLGGFRHLQSLRLGLDHCQLGDPGASSLAVALAEGLSCVRHLTLGPGRSTQHTHVCV